MSPGSFFLSSPPTGSVLWPGAGALAAHHAGGRPVVDDVDEGIDEGIDEGFDEIAQEGRRGWWRAVTGPLGLLGLRWRVEV